MSWGERSCKWLYNQDKKCKPELKTCNVNCPQYEMDFSGTGLFAYPIRYIKFDSKLK